MNDFAIAAGSRQDAARSEADSDRSGADRLEVPAPRGLPSWRDAAVYRCIERLAWELLRRNPAYRRDFARCQADPVAVPEVCARWRIAAAVDPADRFGVEWQLGTAGVAAIDDRAIVIGLIRVDVPIGAQLADLARGVQAARQAWLAATCARELRLRRADPLRYALLLRAWDGLAAGVDPRVVGSVLWPAFRGEPAPEAAERQRNKLRAALQRVEQLMGSPWEVHAALGDDDRRITSDAIPRSQVTKPCYGA